MAARDNFHQAVKQALIKEGWTITDDPLVVQFGGVDLYIDLGAEKIIAAEKDGSRIAVEIKSFLGSSLVSEFHKALGQFLNYHFALQEQGSDRELYLAVPVDIHSAFFTLAFTQGVLQKHHIKLIVYNPKLEVITQWISS